MDQPIVATERAVPLDISGRAVQEGDDFAATATTAGLRRHGTFVYSSPLGRWSVTHATMATRAGSPQAVHYLSIFVEWAKKKGLIQRAINAVTPPLIGVQVPPPQKVGGVLVLKLRSRAGAVQIETSRVASGSWMRVHSDGVHREA